MFDRERETVGCVTSLMVGGAYWTAGYSSGRFPCLGDIASEAADAAAARAGDIAGPVGVVPGGRGAARKGIVFPPDIVGDIGPRPSPTLRGGGGAALGFSKLSSLLGGKRGLCGGLTRDAKPELGVTVGDVRPLGGDICCGVSRA